MTSGARPGLIHAEVISIDIILLNLIILLFSPVLIRDMYLLLGRVGVVWFAIRDN